MDTKNTFGAKQAKVKTETESVENTVGKITDVVENKLETAKEKVSDNITNIAEKVQEKTDSSQKFLDDKAVQIGKYAHQTVDNLNKLGQKATDAITNSTDYIKNFDVERARESVTVAIKEKPEATIVAVALLGLVVGYLVGRKTA